MESQVSKKITEEEFRSCYPDVSIQGLSEKAAPKGFITEKKQQIKSPVKTISRSPVSKLQPVSVKTPQNSAAKLHLNTPKINTLVQKTTGQSLVQSKLSSVAKSPANLKSLGTMTPNNSFPSSVTKTPVTSKTPVAIKTFQINKTVGQAVNTIPNISNSANTKSVETLLSVSKQTMPKLPIQKTPQTVVKQSLNSAVKQGTLNHLVKSSANTPVVKSDASDNSVTVLYNMPQRPSKQLTIEKIEPQQRVPIVLDATNQAVLQQAINNGQLVVQSKVATTETTPLQVIGAPVSTTVVGTKVDFGGQRQTLQVSEQVTLFRPKGTAFNVDEVKKQINLKSQHAITNIVSSTTSSTPATAASASSQQDQQKKVVVLPARVATVKNPVKPSGRAPLKVQQYDSTQGQTRHVSPKREIPMQKVLPLTQQPTSASEQEVTTSEENPQPPTIILILPSGEKKNLDISKDIPLNITLQQLLKSNNIEWPENVLPTMPLQISPLGEGNLTEESVETHWEPIENMGSEPSEIKDKVRTRSFESLMGNQSQVVDSQKEPDTENIPALLRDGFLAVCSFCGMASDNFSCCPRCGRHIPPDCKTVPSDILPANVQTRSLKTKADSLTAESPKKKKICKRRKTEEPVCLTISDDEELLGLSHHTHDSYHSDTNSQISSCDKEPIITEDMVSELKHSISAGGTQDGEERLDNASPSERTYLQCRTVRIGSYKVVPKDKVLITPHGLKFTVPVLNSDKYVEIKIMYQEIIKVLMHFGRMLPVLFFYTRPVSAAKIRRALRMEDKNSCYYDTTSSDETHRRITFLPDKIDDDCKAFLKRIFGNPENNIYAELSGKEANDILVKASPKEVQAFILKKQPNNIPQQQQQPQPFDGQNIQTIMIYPPPPEKGGIPINTEDYACLGEDQFLNDVIIDFYLKYVVEKTLSPEDRARTHVFSSFFYKRLTTKPPAKRKSMNPIENDPAASPAAKRHSRVKSWTKNVNLFTKDFIVIPINENSHWFLAIVCFPGLTGPVRFSDNTPIQLPGRQKNVTGQSVYGSTTITELHHDPSSMDMLDETDDRDEADDKDELMDVPDVEEDALLKPVHSEEDGDHEVVKKKQPREPIKQPCILIFDSLAGASRSRVVATLRDYLRVEYEAKHGESRDFSGDVLKGSNLKCPQQTNYTDCGLYVLQYVEAFFQWPVTDYHIPIKQLQDWFQAEIVSRKRYEIQQLLHRLMQEQNIDIDLLNLPLLNLKPGCNSLMEYSGTEDEEEEEVDEEDHMCEDEEDMMEGDEDYHDEMEHDHEEMEDGEICHHEDEDPDPFLDLNMSHENQDMDDEDFQLDENSEEELDLADEIEEEMEDKELDGLSIRHHIPGKVSLKNIRNPRLAIRMPDTFKED